MSAVIVTTRDKFRTLAARFSAQYGSVHRRVGDTTTDDVMNGLARLDMATCSVDDIAKVACFLPGWVRIDCDHCHADTDIGIVVGDTESEDYERREATLCPKCLVAAVALLEDRTAAAKDKP